MMILAFLAQTLRIAMPYLFASAGGVVSERAGLIGLTLEGYMLIAAFCAALGSYFGGNPWFGVLAGIGGGAVQIGAPPLLIFWLGGDNKAVTVRANVMVFFIAQGFLSLIAYTWSGLLTGETIMIALLLGLPFAAAMAAGVYSFHGSSDALYRRVTYLIIAFAGLASMPVFDTLR